MQALRAWKYRLYPTKEQQTDINRQLWICKGLWNKMLAFTKEIYKNYEKFPTKRTLREFVKNTGLYSQVGQELVDRFFDAISRKIVKKAGFPRFKIDSLKSLVYPQSGFKLENKKVYVSKFGEIEIKKHRDLSGKVKTLTIKKDPSGKFYAIFVTELDIIPKENQGPKIGIDLGLKNFATLSDGSAIANPRYIVKYEKKLAFIQKKFSSKKKGSKNSKKAKIKVAILHEKVKNTRSDFLHKLSHMLVHTYSFLALEDLSSSKMIQEKFGKQIMDASWNKFINMLLYKAESAGCRVVLVNPKNTTKQCSCCGFLSNKQLWDRIHICPKCNLSLDRDHNAALNILIRAKTLVLATGGQPGSNACGDVSIKTSLKQEGSSALQC